MKIHAIKLQRQFYDDVLSGRKNFEIRENDGGYQCGDFLDLKPWDTSNHCYCEPYTSIKREISYVLSGWGLKDGYVALGLKDPQQSEE